MSKSCPLTPERKAQAIDDCRYQHMMAEVRAAMDKLHECETKSYIRDCLIPALENYAPLHDVSWKELDN